MRPGDDILLFHLVEPGQKGVVPNELFRNEVVEMNEAKTAMRKVRWQHVCRGTITRSL